MNPTNHNPDLSRSLARHADQFARRGGSELEIDQVLARAGVIRRGRRMRATIVMAAVVAAIVVPVGIVSVGTNGNERPNPAEQVRIDDSPLTLDGLRTGAVPKIGYATSDAWHPRAGQTGQWAAEGRITGVARVGDGFVVALSDDEGNQMAEVVADDTSAVPGRTHTVFDLSGGFAVSDGGNVVAFVKPDGTPVVVQDNGRTTYTLPRIPRGTGFEAAAVIGEDCAPPTAPAGGCVVWAVSHGDQPEAWAASHDSVGPSDLDLQSVTITVERGLIAGITEVKDDPTTCSAVLRFDEEAPLWSICGHHPTAFSPAGTHLLAEADGDGLGTTGLALYDAETGKVLLELATADGAFIPQAMWEDDTHVLARVYENGRWAILRIGLDGSREYAVAPVAGFEDVDSPFVLPAR